MSPEEVRDSFFAFVIGILRSGIEVSFDGAAMRDVLTEFKTSLELPFDLIDNVTQRGVKGSNERIISITFFRPASIPIPFSLLGYHPGSIRATARWSSEQNLPRIQTCGIPRFSPLYSCCP